MQSLIHKPLITEKTVFLASRGWYTFAVASLARKEYIAREIGKMYNVSVVSVRTIAMHGKVRRTGKRMIATHKVDWKKALVQLKAGQKIDAFEVTNQAPMEEEAPVEAKATTSKKTEKTAKATK